MNKNFKRVNLLTPVTGALSMICKSISMQIRTLGHILGSQMFTVKIESS